MLHQHGSTAMAGELELAEAAETLAKKEEKQVADQALHIALHSFIRSFIHCSPTHRCRSRKALHIALHAVQAGRDRWCTVSRQSREGNLAAARTRRKQTTQLPSMAADHCFAVCSSCERDADAATALFSCGFGSPKLAL
jgi:hypothetical protein